MELASTLSHSAPKFDKAGIGLVTQHRADNDLTSLSPRALLYVR